MNSLELNNIFYVKPSATVAFRWDEKIADKNNLLDTHEFLIKTPKSDLDEIFEEMQAENWSPNGEARELIKGKNLNHTSMSVGDVVQIGFVFYQVVPVGFMNLNTGEMV